MPWQTSRLNLFPWEILRLHPFQVGVAVPGGAEAAVHVARHWMHRNRDAVDKVFFKLDLKNAFNTVDRTALLRAVRQDFPEIVPWADWCYARPSDLYLGKKTISSQCGVQQGDPLGPLLFSLAIQPVILLSIYLQEQLKFISLNKYL